MGFRRGNPAEDVDIVIKDRKKDGMGHSNKQMVYDVYGNYVDGLEEDAEKIYRYFGRDFLIQESARLRRGG